jgi:glutathione synthase/RimK-type ligase-like ATP-grasp enzyme
MATDQKLGSIELLFKCAQQMGFTPTWITPYGTFAISVNGQEQYISIRSSLNSAAGAGFAKNKYVTRRILERHGLPNIPFVLPSSQSEAASFLAQHEQIIAKPVTGAGARDIHIISTRSQLEKLDISNYILEKFITGKEMRYLILNREVIGVHRSEYGTSVDEHRPLQRISYPKMLWDPALTKLSLRVADILNLKFAAVDYLVEDSGRVYFLEVNTVPGLKWFHAPTSGPIVDVAHLFLESMLEDLQRIKPALQVPHAETMEVR